jgi:hypothetical protein
MRPLPAPAAVLALAVAFAAPSRAAGIEVHANAGFDLDIAGVELAGAPPGGALAWSPLDLAGMNASGALRITGPAGAYVVTACVHPSMPFGRYAYEFGVRASAAEEASLFAELVPMFGGDSPETDGPCARPWVDYASTGGRFTGAATFRTHIASGYAWPDVFLRLVVHKADTDVLVDDWSLVLEADPLVVDGFE